MTDRELLELAAKAVVNKSWHGNESYMRGFMSTWNPLTNDADAFRLMVDLRLWRDNQDICCIERVEDHNGDAYAATRRAIVRAAAEIGAQM